jgi:DNA-binding GntR family transcriptional regulator
MPRIRQKAAAVEDQVYRQVVQAVMEHRLPPGAKLDEERLAEIFSVSRTRIRKVISLLANDQIVTHRLNHGAFVSSPSIKEARDIFQARRGIEQFVVKLCCAKRPKINLSELRAFVRQESHAYEKGNKATNRMSGDFHVLLASLTGNEVVRSIVERLAVRTNLVQAVYGPSKICLVHEHDDIVDALDAKDAEKAIELMDRHLESIERACDFTDPAKTEVDLAAIFPIRM